MSTIYVVKQYSPLRDGPAVHGAVIPGAAIGAGTIVVIEQSKESPHDGWGQIVGPPISQPGGLVMPDGTYLKYHKVAWIEIAHLGPINSTEHEYRLITDAETGAVKSCVLVR